MEPPEPRIPMTTERLPVDEAAVLSFLSRLAGDRDAFVARTLDLVAMLTDCSVQRFGLLVRRLEDRGLLERRRLNHIGTEWGIFAKMQGVATHDDDRFVIPQNRLQWPNVIAYAKGAKMPDVATHGGRYAIPQNRSQWPTVKTHAKQAALLKALPLVGQVPARKPPVHFFPRGKSGFDFLWHIVDARGDAVKDCSSVHATLFRGRSAFGVGGVAVAGFDVAMQSVGEGDYVARVTIGAAAECGSDYTVVVDARRHGKHFGHFEVPSAVIDP